MSLLQEIRILDDLRNEGLMNFATTILTSCHDGGSDSCRAPIWVEGLQEADDARDVRARH